LHENFNIRKAKVLQLLPQSLYRGTASGPRWGTQTVRLPILCSSTKFFKTPCDVKGEKGTGKEGGVWKGKGGKRGKGREMEDWSPSVATCRVR